MKTETHAIEAEIEAEEVFYNNETAAPAPAKAELDPTNLATIEQRRIWLAREGQAKGILFLSEFGLTPREIQRSGTNEKVDEIAAALATSGRIQIKDQEWLKRLGLQGLGRPSMASAVARPAAAANPMEAFAAMMQAAGMTGGGMSKEEIIETVSNSVAELEDEVKAEIEGHYRHISATLEAISEATKSGASARMGIAKAIAVATGKAPATAHPILEKLMLYCAPGDAVCPLEILGEAGTSKTYLAEQFGRDGYGPNFFIVDGNPSMTKLDFLGGTLVGEHGTFWTDGPLTEAFRVAADGGNAMVLLDERRRMPAPLLGILVGMLNPRPHPTTGEPCYTLRTGRIMSGSHGVDVTEVLYAPVSKLAVVATSNESAKYNATLRDDPAERSRWERYRVAFDVKECASVIEAMLSGHPAPCIGGDAANVSVKLASVVDQTREAVAIRSSLSNVLTLRHLSRVIRTSIDLDNMVVRLGEIAQGDLVGITASGEPEPEQIKEFERILATQFSGTTL